ncbi:amidohydrolase [Allonocardiopsis opalescens]|uniref:5-methylthioadenosine/S-adenosylhomocysteine deaminase n=1 Tax=Allonocardiopsis opalescens TaxID=1144618 RepID=A0A2T0Q6M6_9ACTN|nr:amidohydrolase [Allonocardiopsis opalescens]PRX99480.1 5-methylthioadenosine/S-adenosylhomocysteine deaminase [Allonocardiopsis opalescens]
MRQETPTAADLVVTGGTLLAMDGRPPLPGGAVAVRDGAVLAVGTAAEVAARHPAAEVVDACGGLVLPGLVNTHTHLAMTLLRGVADDVDTHDFLARVLPMEAGELDAELVGLGAELAIAESIRAGTTTALDMYWYHEAAAAAAERTGFRLLAGPVFMDLGEGPDGRGYAERIPWARADLAGYAPGPGGRRYVFPHSVYALGPDRLREVAALAREHGALLHVHAAETAGEVAAAVERYGRRPVELLADTGLLGPDVLLAHAVHLTDDEIAEIARTGTAVAHCPASNLKLACGVAPLPALLEAGVPVGLGTDGAVTSNTLDMFTVLRLTALLHKGGGDPTAVPAEQAVRLATLGGAEALGAAGSLGALAPGHRADIVVVDLDRPHLRPHRDPWSALAYAAAGADVRHVVIDGRVVLRDRELTTIDEARLLARVDEAVERLSA